MVAKVIIRQRSSVGFSAAANAGQGALREIIAVADGAPVVPVVPHDAAGIAAACDIADVVAVADGADVVAGGVVIPHDAAGSAAASDIAGVVTVAD